MQKKKKMKKGNTSHNNCWISSQIEVDLYFMNEYQYIINESDPCTGSSFKAKIEVEKGPNDQNISWILPKF